MVEGGCTWLGRFSTVESVPFPLCRRSEELDLKISGVCVDDLLLRGFAACAAATALAFAPTHSNSVFLPRFLSLRKIFTQALCSRAFSSALWLRLRLLPLSAGASAWGGSTLLNFLSALSAAVAACKFIVCTGSAVSRCVSKAPFLGSVAWERLCGLGTVSWVGSGSASQSSTGSVSLVLRLPELNSCFSCLAELS